MLGTPWRRAHRGFERCGSVVRPQEGYIPEILSHLSYEYVPSKGIRGLFLERTINSTIIIIIMRCQGARARGDHHTVHPLGCSRVQC